MQRRIRRLRAALFVAALAALAPYRVRGEIVDKILATVDGEPITLHELDKYAHSTIRGRQVGTADQSALLDALITDRIIQREVSDRGIIVRDEDVDRYIGAIKQRNNLDDEKLQAALANQGVSYDAYRAQIREEIERDQLINRDIRGKVNVTPEEVQRYYDAHLSEYSTPERVQVAHILLRLPQAAPADQVAAITAKADDIYQRIKKGADFGEMAKQYSEDPSSQSGGELGWFKQGELLDELEKAAAKLQVGEVSRPVRSKAGVHILKLEAREGASHTKLDELSDQIKEQLYNAALEDRFQKWLTEDLRKRHHVEMR